MDAAVDVSVDDAVVVATVVQDPKTENVAVVAVVEGFDKTPNTWKKRRLLQLPKPSPWDQLKFKG